MLHPGRQAAEHPRGPRRIVARQMTQIELLQHTGFRRVGSPRSGFRFVGAPPREVPRLRSVRIPPAWTDVAVSRNPRARLLAVGRDKKGRWQYVYSQAAVREREQRKYEKLIAFGRALPRLRRAIDRGMRLRGLPRERVMACILRILSTCFMLPGSQVYAKENGSFGIATLQRRHASVHGDTVHFEYRGKAGKMQGRELIVAAIKETAAQLGNTPAVCKASYIWPSVLRDFEKGRVLKPYYRTLDELVEARSYAAERALLELLKTGRSALPAPPQRARRPEAKMGRRMRRSPRARRLARAFTLH